MAGRFASVFGIVAVASMSAAAPISGASAADLIAPGPYVAAGPDSLCGETRHLNDIHKGFDMQAREVHHQPDLSILEISNFRENRYEPAVIDDTIPDVSVERLYCQASAYMSDGQTRTLWYLVEYEEGFAGAFGDNVEFCVSGLEPWKVYNSGCRIVR